jgi:hypothetical protein
VSSADVASAKGALFTISLGHRPRDWLWPEKISANSAIHFRKGSVETRFQRLFQRRSESWGDAPGSPEARLWRQAENGLR